MIFQLLNYSSSQTRDQSPDHLDQEQLEELVSKNFDLEYERSVKQEHSDRPVVSGAGGSTTFTQSTHLGMPRSS